MDLKKDIGKSIIELEKELMDNEELLMARAGDVEIFYKNHFKHVLALREHEWLRSLGEKDWTKDSIEHAIWHQGALHCLKEIREWFEEQVTLSLSKFQPKEEKPEPGEVIPPIE